MYVYMYIFKYACIYIYHITYYTYIHGSCASFYFPLTL